MEIHQLSDRLLFSADLLVKFSMPLTERFWGYLV